jgi:hypothetical protein
MSIRIIEARLSFPIRRGSVNILLEGSKNNHHVKYKLLLFIK